MNWEKLSTKQLLDHPRIAVFEDTIRLPNGTETDYIYFEKDYGAASVIAINSEGKILVQKEYSYPPNKVLYQFPGGGIHKDEEPITAAHRELAEEASLKGNIQQIGWFYVDNRRKKSKNHVFIVTSLEQSVDGVKDAEEELEDFWFTEAEIDELIANQEFVIYSGLAAWAIYKNYLAGLKK